ncbi:MAG: DUF2341 domain-containing protein, partial [Patescibacteria group bacterium]|nr:DUF2341 domain-containing protein [Patescibacteria group bacterium]
TDGATYCFRLYDNTNAAALSVYTNYAQVTLKAPRLTQAHARWRNDDGVENWYNSAWGYREKITIDHTKVSGASDLTNFPVLINRTDINWRYTGSGGHVAQSNGNDIMFTGDDGTTKLNHEIEKYTSSTGELVAWVKIPTLSITTDTVIYIYYGNVSCANQENMNGVWDSNYRMVTHLDETAQTSGSYNDHQDSTSYGNNGEAMNGVTMTATGNIDGADSFDNTDDYIACGTSSLPTVGSNVTLSVWAYYSTAPGTDNLILVDNESSAAYQLGFRGGNASSWGWGGIVYVSSTVPGANAWHFYTYTYDSSTQTHRLYVDGVNTSTNTTAAQSGTPTLNSINTDRWGENFGGSIDEARISNITRSAAWIATEYNNQSSPSTFCSVASEEAGASANSATFAADEDTILNNYVKGNNIRVRFEIANTGTLSSSNAYRLQVAETATCSSGTYADVLTDSSGHWQISDSSYITDGEATQNISPGLTDYPSSSFVAGQLKDAGNTTGSITLTNSNFTEIEFSIKALDAATNGGHYCFRLYNATSGAPLYVYTNYAEIGVVAGSQFNQSAYRFFQNENGVTVNTALAAQDSAANLTTTNEPFRLRVLLHISGSTLAPGASDFKLQYAVKSGTCDTAFSGESYADITGVTPIAYYNNSSPADGAAAILNVSLDPAHSGHTNIGQTYEEANNFTSINSVAAGQDALWDFSLINTSAISRQSYCLRAINSDGSVLDTYTVIPEIITSPIYPVSASYISSAFDTGTSSVFTVLEWTWSKSNPNCAACIIKLQLESAPTQGELTGTWCGPNSCSGTDYYTVNTGQMINTIHNGHRWIRYKASFETSGTSTPILDDTKVYYDDQN